jgi:hypothetical protein
MKLHPSPPYSKRVSRLVNLAKIALILVVIIFELYGTKIVKVCYYKESYAIDRTGAKEPQ